MPDPPRVKGQRSMNSIKNDIFVYAITQEFLVGFWSNFVQWYPWCANELIRFWARSTQGQRSKVNELYIIMLFSLRLRDNSRSPSQILFKLSPVVPHDVPTNWLDFGPDPLRVKGQRSMNSIKKCYFHIIYAITQEVLYGFWSNLAQRYSTKFQWTD